MLFGIKTFIKEAHMQYTETSTNWLINKMLDGLIIISLTLLYTLPFLITYSYYPVGKFHAEFLSLVLGIAFSMFAILRAERISISNVGIACILFIIFLFIQMATLNLNYPGIHLVIIIEALAAFFVSVGVSSLIDGKENAQLQLIKYIAWAIVISSTIQAIYGLIQYLGYADNFSSIILASSGRDVIGNIGQRNDYGDFISMGIFALSYLYFSKQIRLITFIPYAAFILFIIAINGSRSSLVYFVLVIIMMSIFIWCNRNRQDFKLFNRQTIMIIIGITMCLLLFQFAAPIIISFISNTQALDANTVTAVDRFSNFSTAYRRIYEWYKDIILFVEHPIIGIGWQRYSYYGIDIMNTKRFMYIPLNYALYTHSHNTPLNILAEGGIVGFLITMVYGFAYALYKMFRNFNNHATLFLSFVILTIFGQSCFQYPLWYAYYLIFFVLMLSADKPVIVTKNNLGYKIAIVALFIGFVVFYINNTIIYSRIVSYTIVPQDDDDYTNNVSQLTNLISNNILWAFPAALVLDNYIYPASAKTNAIIPLQYQIGYIDRLATQTPYPGLLFKAMLVNHIANNMPEAIKYANTLAHAYPAFKDKFAEQLANAPEFKVEYAILRNFKYEDHSIFANRKDANKLPDTK
jgi:O-antigen ligase